jgi:hypothetical protein
MRGLLHTEVIQQLSNGDKLRLEVVHDPMMVAVLQAEASSTEEIRQGTAEEPLMTGGRGRKAVEEASGTMASRSGPLASLLPGPHHHARAFFWVVW